LNHYKTDLESLLKLPPNDISNLLVRYLVLKKKYPLLPTITIVIVTYNYNCYECIRANHGTPVYQSNSRCDYESHWINSGHNGPCYPGIADIEKHGWIAQGREWEI
jgi:hypothetical protein